VRLELGHLVVAREGHAAGERLEEHAAERVDVGARVAALAAHELRRHEVDRADHHARLCERDVPGHRRVDAAGDPEVGEVGVLGAVLVARHQNVRGLDVAVHQSAPVRRVQRRRDRQEQSGRARRLERALVEQQRSQVCALDPAL
jgi:hypothetical protein